MSTGEVDARTEAALDLAGTYVFGTDPGRIPSVLFEAYEATSDERDKARLGAALARCWAYAGERHRAVPFAVSAVKHAEASDDPILLADALDAALATHWGPDELEVRVELARKLSDVAAHLADVEVRTQAHLWLLTVAAETLDVSELNRHMRALEVMADESRKALFFAASRRLALDLMRGRTDTIEPLVKIAESVVDVTPDAVFVVHCMVLFGAVQAGDWGPDVIERARAGEEIAEQEGILVLTAEIAWLYLNFGLLEDARRLLGSFDSRVLSRLPHDHNYLLGLHLVLDVALGVGADEVVAQVVPLLMPFAGRSVINAGFVVFLGVTDDTLSRGCAMLGDADRAMALREKALETYRRIGATWWRERLEAALPARPSAPTPGSLTLTMRPGPAGVWLVGQGSVEAPIPARRGLEHLHQLLSQPGVEVAALVLAGGRPTPQQSGIAIIDDQALAAYRRRLSDIDAELDEADAWADEGRAEALSAEREALLAEVAAATGLAGRTRETGGDAERARVTVRKAIASAIEAIHAADPLIARHLTTRVHTGLYCRYDPDPDAPVTWKL